MVPAAPEGLAAVPVGGGGAWPGFATSRQPGATGVEGPEGTGGLRRTAPNDVRSPSHAGGRALRSPQHPWGHKQPDPKVSQRAYETGAASAGGDHQKFETAITTARRRGHENCHCPLAGVSPVSINTADRCATVPPVSLNKRWPGYSGPSCTRHAPSRSARATKFAQHNPSNDFSAK